MRFAENIWKVYTTRKTDEQVAEEGLAAMKNRMKELGLVMNITELGADEGMIEGLADSTLILDGGYKVPESYDIIAILRNCL